MDMEETSGAIGIVPMLFIIALAALMIVSTWKLFTKAGRPGWASLIPIYNIWVLLEIVKKPAWWLVLMLVPIVQIVPLVLMPFWIAKSFGKSAGYGVGLLLLPFVFQPMLAFGDAKYDPRGAAGDIAPVTA